MGLFQNLLETYDKCQKVVGIARNDPDGEINENKTLLPVFHTTLRSEICVIINDKGDFLDAQRDNKVQTIIIPCTENSEGRSGKVTEENVNAHPLCDQIDYVSGLDEIKYNNYIKGLEKWKNFASGVSKIKLEALYTYISKKTMIIDLINKGVFKDAEFDFEGENKNINFEKIRKIGVRFCIQIPFDLKDKVWEDDDLRQSWIDYIKAQAVTDRNTDKDYLFDYISGVRVFKAASQHPKKINLATPNSKLVSCNDTSGFTFRGRFENQDQAIIIDFEQSQKMHQVLKWLINNYGYNIDTQSIIVWAVDDNTEPETTPYKNSCDLFEELESKKTNEELISEAETEIFADYSKKLNNYLLGYGKDSNITQHYRKICIAIFDAATPGRMGLTFYQELNEKKYLENIVKWHNETSYYLTAWIKESDNNPNKKSKPVAYVGAPSFDDIIFAVYGNPRSQNDRTYQIFKRKMRKQLLECMFGNFPFPKNIVEQAAARASNPLSFTDKNNSFSVSDWRKSLGISCALARKYIKQQKKEEIKMELEEKRNDRDYLYGRLLAIADKLENFALYKSEKKDERATNAVRLMNAFSVKPYQTWLILYNQITPYINQLKGANFYRSLIDEVMVLFKAGDYESNKPLSPLYLLGYSAQYRALSNKKEENNNVE
jgi:CRISPR-associated protein Csd1